MELPNQRLQKIERREGQLWLMTVFVIMAFTIVLIVKHASELIGAPDSLSLENEPFLVGLPIISILFCAYVLQSSYRLRRIKSQLIEVVQEKTQIQQLLVEVKAQSDALAQLNEQLKNEISERELVEVKLKEANTKLVNREAKLLDVLERLRKAHEELKATQLQLIQTAKLESVGRLAAGVAHEVKNPLATILLGTEYLTHRLASGDDRIREVLHDMGMAIKKADSVIIGLMDYSVNQAVNLTSQDLNPIVEQALILLKYELDKFHITVVTSLESTLPSLKLDRRKIEQAIVNIILNAIQAMPNGGTLTVKSYVAKAEQCVSIMDPRLLDRFAAGESMVVIIIEDTGSGIPATYLPSIYDPFFTGRPAGKGTGLGLTVARNIVDIHGGVIHIQNREGTGARVAIALRITRDHHD